jgi:hypothetical protein
MSSTTQAPTRPAADVIRETAVSQAANGVCFAIVGEAPISSAELERLVNAVPQPIATALRRKAYYFVPLTVNSGDDTLIAERYDVALSDQAVCHRNFTVGDSQCVFISTRLMDEKFSIAFEFYINVAHAFVEVAGVSQQFGDLAWKQAQDRVRGETSVDAHELRKLAAAAGGDTEKAKTEYFQAAFSDAIAIYLLGTFLDVDYYDLRERDYTLLAPAALAERLRLVNQLFPPNSGFEFHIFHRRKQ